MPTTAAEYRDAALERMGDANALYRLGRYPLAMYAAGVVVECMLRAFRHVDREHEAHHDVIRHLGACDQEHLGDRGLAKLRGPVQTSFHLLWLNNFRYMDERRLRRHLNEVMFYKRVKKGSDTLKVACIELMDAALQ